jgi:cysteine desulfurase / selenocysteine lyase
MQASVMVLRAQTFDVEEIRQDFPILKRKIDGKPLVYLDNAATTQKPRQVIQAISEYYENHNANIHRAVHTLAEEATTGFEDVRDKTAAFIHARKREEIIFTRGTTEATNLVRYGWGRFHVKKDDRILLTEMEHHSNIVPWQLLAKENGASLEYVRITDDGRLVLDDYEKYLADGKTKLVCVTMISNVLGTINPIREIVAQAHAAGARVLVDAAQGVPHVPTNVQNLDCDFLAFSSHKMLGPTGVGVLYGRVDALQETEPFHGGGDMIKEVHLRESKWNDLPWKFEAGTSNIADVIGFGAALDYLNQIGLENISEHEAELTRYALEQLSNVPKLEIYGPKDTENRASVISFNLGDIHAHDMASILNDDGIAVRSGHHCAQPLMERLGVNATTRASFYIYNTRHEVDTLTESLNKAAKMFKL